ncbi:MAG: response regulator [Anaerolineales bacterium]
MPQLRILLVDDHEVVRLGLKSLLSRRPGFEIVAETGMADEAVRLARAHNPDVVLLDIRLPGKSGIEACAEITAELPDTKVIMLTSYAEDDMLFSAIRAGAAGYVLKQIGGDELVRSIEAASRGEAPLDPALTQRVFAEVRKAVQTQEAAAFGELTQQEMRVLAAIADGKTNREIAAALYLGEGTVRNYVSSILSKLHVANRAEAAAYAVQHKIRDFIEETDT